MVENDDVGNVNKKPGSALVVFCFGNKPTGFRSGIVKLFDNLSTRLRKSYVTHLRGLWPRPLQNINQKEQKSSKVEKYYIRLSLKDTHEFYFYRHF